MIILLYTYRELILSIIQLEEKLHFSTYFKKGDCWVKKHSVYRKYMQHCDTLKDWKLMNKRFLRCGASKMDVCYVNKSFFGEKLEKKSYAS